MKTLKLVINVNREEYGPGDAGLGVSTGEIEDTDLGVTMGLRMHTWESEAGRPGC